MQPDLVQIIVGYELEGAFGRGNMLEIILRMCKSQLENGNMIVDYCDGGLKLNFEIQVVKEIFKELQDYGIIKLLNGLLIFITLYDFDGNL